MAFTFDANNNLNVNVQVGGGGSGSNAAAGPTGSPVPSFADYEGVNIGGNLVGVTGLALGSTTKAPTVAIVDGSGNQITTFGGGQQYADDVASGAAPTGTLAMGWDVTNSVIRALQVDILQQLLVSDATLDACITNQTVRVDGSGVTQPISGTVTADQGGAPWSVTFPSSQQVLSNAAVDANNTSTTLLGSNGVFTGTGTDLLAYAGIEISVFADQASAASGFQIQFSTDNVNWQTDQSNTVNASQQYYYTKNRHARYFRIVYTNGGTAQGIFRLQTILQPFGMAPQMPAMTEAIDASIAGILTRSVLMGQTSVGGIQNLIVKPASTAPLAADAALVVSISPNTPTLTVGGSDGTNIHPLNADTVGNIGVNVKNIPTVSLSSGPTVVQHLSGYQSTGGTGTFQLTFPTNNIQGDVLVVMAQLSSGVTITGMSDSQGNTYVSQVNDYTGGLTASLYIWYCASCKAGANTVTVTVSGTTNQVLSLEIAEIYGLSQSSLLIGSVTSSNASGTTTTETTGPLSVSANAFIIGIAGPEAGYSPGTYAPASPFTVLDSTPRAAMFYGTSAGGSQSVTLNWTTSAFVQIGWVAFTSAAGMPTVAAAQGAAGSAAWPVSLVNAAQETGGNLATIASNTRNEAQITDLLAQILAQAKYCNMLLASGIAGISAEDSDNIASTLIQ